MAQQIRFMSICGLLGYGFPEESLRAGLDADPAFLGVDSGSSDPGPYYLGSGTSFLKPLQLKRDLELALCAAREKNIPLIVGTAGGSGAAPHVDTFLAILREIARRRNLSFRMAVIHADIEASIAVDALRAGRISPCGGSGELDEDTINACDNLVAQMGTDPIIEAVEGGADVVVAGRCCDTAIFAAIPIMQDFNPGLALHLAKIAECGTICAQPGGANDSLVCELRKDHFIVEPANPRKSCFPHSVAAHSLYEQPDPDCFHEPEGKVDLCGCTFEQHGPRSVKVSGARLLPPLKPTVKLEGAVLRGYRSITVSGTCDPAMIDALDSIEKSVRQAVADNLLGTFEADDYSLRFLRYGLDAVTGMRLAPADQPPREVGLVIEAVAPSQDMADTVLSLARSTTLHAHYPGRKTTAGNLAFPFSPSDYSGGAVYEFGVYHLMETAGLGSLFPINFEEVH
ncbi:MAG: acyclic terpene utilization AtuA family protein [Planctomycetota bacterium]|nr:acyclic terpene utilization AtuA family protein [Planctomycetota bacterium]